MAETIEYTLNCRPLADATNAELFAEWNAGMFFDAIEGLTEDRAIRLKAIEAEMDRREWPDEPEAQP